MTSSRQQQQQQPRPRASTTTDQIPDAWLADDAGDVPAETLLAYRPSDTGDAERYCLALYHQMDNVPDRPVDEFDTLWARTAQLDPERRLLKASYDLSLLDVCYDTLRHANLIGRWIRPRPHLARLIEKSRCLKALYNESTTKSTATTFTPPGQYVKNFIANLLMTLFLYWTLGFPRKLFPTLLSTIIPGKVFVEVVALAVGLSVVLALVRLVLRLPRAPSLLVSDEYTAGVLRSGSWSVFWRSVVADVLDEVINRWMGINALGFLLSLLNMAMTHYLGSVMMVAALVGVVSERCSLRAIVTVAGLAFLTVYGQLSNISLLWELGHFLRSVMGAILSKVSSTVLDTSMLEERPDLLTALMLQSIRLPTTLTLKPWRFADFFAEPCRMILSSLIWSLVLSHGFLTAVIARFAFSIVSGLLLWMVQGPISLRFADKKDKK